VERYLARATLATTMSSMMPNTDLISQEAEELEHFLHDGGCSRYGSLGIAFLSEAIYAVLALEGGSLVLLSWRHLSQLTETKHRWRCDELRLFVSTRIIEVTDLISDIRRDRNREKRRRRGSLT